MRKYTKFFILVVFIFCFCAIYAQKKVKTKPVSNYLLPDSAVSAFWGNENIAYLFHPDSVVVLRINPQRTDNSNSTLIVGYKQEYRVGKIDKSYFSILQFLLKDNYNYKPYPSKCEFEPIIAVIFYKQKKSIPLLFCFSCNEWAITNNNKTIITMFDNRKQLISFFKPLFPKDDLIQKL